MMSTESNLISVIITCYNHAGYLPEAINSVFAQTYPFFEIVVVDDGSTDNTKEVTKAYEHVKYVWQHNQGLGAARNTGIDNSKGDYLIFLDADDWLYNEALAFQFEAIKAHPECIAVAGGHYKVDTHGEVIEEEENNPVYEDHYLDLLQGNFIGMHAAVMYRRETFNEFRYDASLKAAEDYDLYLKLTRRHPIFVHRHKIAAYRIHGNNMSKNIPMMLSHVLKVHQRQENELRIDEEKSAYAAGVKIWNDYYTDLLVRNKFYLLNRSIKTEPLLTEAELEILKKNNPKVISKLYTLNTKNRIKRGIKRVIKPFKKQNSVNNKIAADIPVGKIDWGNLKTTKPLSYDFGFDRGGAIDRYYIEKFLEENKLLVKGRVLEVAENTYTLRFGEGRLAKSDVLHLHEGAPGATIAGDLSNEARLPIADNTFDCIILTQTLHFIYDFQSAVRQCFRILKPGGVLLMTVPGITPIDPGEWGKNWLWAFNKQSMQMVMAKNFPSPCEINTFGNVFSATAFLWGAGINEIEKGELLDTVDPSYPIVVTVKAVKQ